MSKLHHFQQKNMLLGLGSDLLKKKKPPCTGGFTNSILFEAD